MSGENEAEWLGEIRDDGPLHALWSKAKDHPDYVKAEWMALERKLSQRNEDRVVRSGSKLEETVTVTREVTGPIKDLVGFVRYLIGRKVIEPVSFSTNELVKLARDFWDREHGEE